MYCTCNLHLEMDRSGPGPSPKRLVFWPGLDWTGPLDGPKTVYKSVPRPVLDRSLYIFFGILYKK